MAKKTAKKEEVAAPVKDAPKKTMKKAALSAAAPAPVVEAPAPKPAAKAPKSATAKKAAAPEKPVVAEKPVAAEKPAPVEKAEAAKPAAATIKAKAAAIKLSKSQLEILAKIGEAGETGYKLDKKAEQRSIDILSELKLIKKGKKDKADDKVIYSLSAAGKKHLESVKS